jgi:hypothetical protein
MRRSLTALSAMSIALAGAGTASAASGPAQAAPGQAAAGQATPGQATPGQATPGQAGRAGAAVAGPGSPARLRLPAPTGAFPVGTVSLHLVDRSRANPWAASPPYRELMVSVWYPARDVRRYPVAPQMTPGAAAHFGSAAGAGSQLYGLPAGAVDWAATPTSGHLAAPLARLHRRLPVLLYSPGAEDTRTWQTTMVQDLASRGYAVVTIDHTYDSSEVEFPGGRVVGTLWPDWFQQARQGGFPALAAKVLGTRLADTRFVLDELARLDAGHNPDAERRALPRGLAGGLDLGRVGMFGVSAGGIIVAQAMDEDPRIAAGVDMDGTVESPFLPDPLSLWPVGRHGLDRPFMFLGDPRTTHDSVPSLAALRAHSRGWHADLTLLGASSENSYKDLVPLLPRIARQLGLGRTAVTDAIGDIDPARAVTAENAYVAAFFDRWLRGRDNHLLDGPSRRFPQFAVNP